MYVCFCNDITETNAAGEVKYLQQANEAMTKQRDEAKRRHAKAVVDANAAHAAVLRLCRIEHSLRDELAAWRSATISTRNVMTTKQRKKHLYLHGFYQLLKRSVQSSESASKGSAAAADDDDDFVMVDDKRRGSGGGGDGGGGESTSTPGGGGGGGGRPTRARTWKHGDRKRARQRKDRQ
jgi:hypothetical protein